MFVPVSTISSCSTCNLLRLTSETWYNGDAVAKTYESRFDDLGRVAWIGEANTHDTFNYNVFGQVVRQTQHIDGFASVVTLDYKYDAAGRKTQTTASVGGVKKYETDFDYDRIGRVTSIIQDSKRVDYRYGQSGQLALLKRFDGGKSVVETVYDYDSLGRVKNIDHASADKVFADYDFTWDASGRITDFDIDSLVGVKGDSSYDYDKTGQLTGADHSNQNDETYQYDANGNRSNYETGDHNRLLSDGTYRYMYDAEGNRVSKTNIATGEKEEYTWDHRNRLTKVVFKNASGQEVKIVEYAYDYGQRLVRKTLDTNADGVIEKNSIFVYDSGQIAIEYEGNLLAHKYLWGSKVDELLATDSDWTLTDHLGSVRDVVDNNGVVKNHIVYDSFGNVTSQAGSTTPLFLYTGKLFDVDTKLQNNLNRWYDAKTGRWLSADPIGFAGKDANLYRYVGNATTVFTDNLGLLQVQRRVTYDTKIEKFKYKMVYYYAYLNPQTTTTNYDPEIVVESYRVGHHVATLTGTYNQVNGKFTAVNGTNIGTTSYDDLAGGYIPLVAYWYGKAATEISVGDPYSVRNKDQTCSYCVTAIATMHSYIQTVDSTVTYSTSLSRVVDGTTISGDISLSSTLAGSTLTTYTFTVEIIVCTTGQSGVKSMSTPTGDFINLDEFEETYREGKNQAGGIEFTETLYYHWKWSLF